MVVVFCPSCEHQATLHKEGDKCPCCGDVLIEYDPEKTEKAA